MSNLLLLLLFCDDVDTPNMELEARFILANCYVRKKEMMKAFDELNLLSLAGDQRVDARKLRAYVATRLEPPNYDESLLILDGLIEDFPEDMNLVSCDCTLSSFHINFLLMNSYFKEQVCFVFNKIMQKQL